MNTAGPISPPLLRWQCVATFDGWRIDCSTVTAPDAKGARIAFRKRYSNPGKVTGLTVEPCGVASRSPATTAPAQEKPRY